MLKPNFLSVPFAQSFVLTFVAILTVLFVWRLIYAKNPDMQTRYNSIVNMYFFKYSHVNMLIRIVGC